MNIEKGRYRAVKDCAMDLAGNYFLLDDGGTITVEQTDKNGKQSLVRCGSLIDWMSDFRIRKCFVKDD